MPTLDAVVLSHLHGDHWDRVARSRASTASRRSSPPSTPPGG
ncbi:MAG: hypothetical protein WKF73_08365 [Nocardioidaceae bacterium]